MSLIKHDNIWFIIYGTGNFEPCHVASEIIIACISILLLKKKKVAHSSATVVKGANERISRNVGH